MVINFSEEDWLNLQKMRGKFMGEVPSAMTSTMTTEATDETWMDCIDNEGAFGGYNTVNNGQSSKEAV